MAQIDLPYEYGGKINSLYTETLSPQLECLSDMQWLEFLTLCDQTKTDIVFPKQPQIEMLPEEYDYVILFGGVSQEERTTCATNLFKEGKIKKIVATGGIGFFNTDRITTEAEKMRKRLIDLGVRADAIIMEARSRSTIENIDYSIDMLENDQGCDFDKQRIGLLSSTFHIRRIIGLTKQKMTPENSCLENFYGIGAPDGITDPDNWFKTLKGKTTINKELYLLYIAVKQGKIPDFTFPESNKAKCRRKLK